jgi:chromosome segregation ATPase
MRKAFDANVPKLKPRLRGTAPAEPAAAPSAAVATAPPPATRALPPAHEPAAPAAPPAALLDVGERRDRLEKIKRKIAVAAREKPSLEAPPEPSRAGESALALLKGLEGQLARSRELEDSLRAELARARGELSRAAAESRSARDKLSAAEKILEEKQAILAEMLPEVGALEEERDEAVRRAQALAALDEERQKVLDELSRRAEDAERALAEARAEGDRLGAELDARAAGEARLRSGLAELTRERDALARELSEVRSERDQLLEAKRALEQVHQALSQARARHG